MKQPLVECDMLVEVAADGLMPQRGDFLVCYFTDPQQRRAIAVKVFRQTTINGQATEEVLRLPAPPTRLKPKSKIDWSRALGAPLHSSSRATKMRQYIFDTSEKGQTAFRLDMKRRFKAADGSVDNVARPLIEKKYLEKVVDHGQLGYRFTEAAVTHLRGFANREAEASPVRPTEQTPAQPKNKITIDWQRALGLRQRSVGFANHARQYLFDRSGEKCAWVALAEFKTDGGLNPDAAEKAIRKMIKQGYAATALENGRARYRLTPHGYAYFANFRV
jgi:hypothetical protein